MTVDSVLSRFKHDSGLSVEQSLKFVCEIGAWGQ